MSVGYVIRYYQPHRSTPTEVPIDAGSRQSAVDIFRGFKLNSRSDEQKCLGLWKAGRLVAGEEPRFVPRRESGQLTLHPHPAVGQQGDWIDLAHPTP